MASAPPDVAALQTKNEELEAKLAALESFVRANTGQEPDAVLRDDAKEASPTPTPASTSAQVPSGAAEVSSDGRGADGAAAERASPAASRSYASYFLGGLYYLWGTDTEAADGDAEGGEEGGRTLEWSGEPEALEELAGALLATRGLRDCRLDCAGLSVLPAAPDVWAHVAPTLRALSLRGNALTELPAAMAELRALHTLALEGNFLRTLPPPVLALSRLRELWLGCNRVRSPPPAPSAHAPAPLTRNVPRGTAERPPRGNLRARRP